MMTLIKSLIIIALTLIPTYSYAADWSELDTIINYDTGKTDYILDIDNLSSDVVTSGTVSGVTVIGTNMTVYEELNVSTIDNDLNSTIVVNKPMMPHRSFMNGSFQETFNALLTSDGATVTMTINNATSD